MSELVKVRDLVWHKSHMRGWNGDWHTVPTACTVRCADEYGWKWSGPGGVVGNASSPEAAKAAAQADYTARILAALDLSAVEAMQAENARLREQIERLHRDIASGAMDPKC